MIDGETREPPLHSRTTDGPGLWGMVVTLMANGTFYLSLIFGWLYLWTASPGWSVPEDEPVALWLVVASGAALTVAWLDYEGAVRALRRGLDQGLQRRLWRVGLMGAGHAALLLWALWDASLAPKALAHDAVLLVMLLYVLGHGGLAALLTVMQAVRVGRGYVGRGLPYEPIVLRPFWVYTVAVFWLSVLVFLLLPMAWGSPS